MYKFVNQPLNVSVTSKKKTLDPQQTYLFLSTHDGGACGYWRSRFISFELEACHERCSCTESRTFFNDQNLLRNASSYRVQRLTRISELEILDFIRNVTGGRLKTVYDIDDILCGEDMPEYNAYRGVFMDTAPVIAGFMRTVSSISVTNDQLKEYYSSKFNIPEKKFFVIPNRPPRHWLDRYHPAIVRDRWERHSKSRLRIGVAAHFSHFGGKDGVDDMSGINDWVIANRKKYQFVFKGGLSEILAPYLDDFEVLPMSKFLHYPCEKQSMDVDVMIQPLQDNIFNRCKSPIKLYESWADGTPCLVQDLPEYRREAPESCFSCGDELDMMLEKLFASKEHYLQVCDNNYHRLDELWLDKNLQPWIEVML